MTDFRNSIGVWLLAAAAFALAGCSCSHTVFVRTDTDAGAAEDASIAGDGATGDPDAGACVLGLDCEFEETAFVRPADTRQQASGASVAISADGLTLAIGAPNDASTVDGVDCDGSNACADPTGTVRGSVQVLARDRADRPWRLEAFIKPAMSRDREFFGTAVSLSSDGDTLAVGGVDQAELGRVHVFRRAGRRWSQEAELMASNGDLEDWFGATLAISGDGDTLAVGANHEGSSAMGTTCDGSAACTDEAAPISGAVYVYRRSAEGEWTQRQFLKASNTGTNDGFGSAVAFSADNDVLVVAALGEDSSTPGTTCDGSPSCTDDALEYAGALYVFESSEEGFRQTAFLKADYPQSGTGLGQYLAISGDGGLIVTGSPFIGAGPPIRAVYGFGRTPTGWAQVAVFGVPGPVFSFLGAGVAVSHDGTVVAVGWADDRGGIELYRKEAGGWARAQSLTPNDREGGQQFPSALAMSGDGSVLVAGSRGEDRGIGCEEEACATDGPNSGAVYVFER
jgi:hypothetical protein